MKLRCPECDHLIRLNNDDERESIRCPECRVKIVIDQDDDDDRSGEERPRKKQPSKQGGKKKRPKLPAKSGFPLVPVLAGAGGFAVIVAIVLLVVLLRGSGADKEVAVKTQPVVSPNTQSTTPPTQPATPPTPVTRIPITRQPVTPTTRLAPTPPTSSTPENTNPMGGPPVGGPPIVVTPPRPTVNPVRPVSTMPGHYAELFRSTVDMKPATIRAATLKPNVADQEPEIPTFHSLIMAKKEKQSIPLQTKSPKMTSEEVKKACVYVKVDAEDMSGTGSGFLVAANGAIGLIATNYHVVESASIPRFGSNPAKVTVVFNTGLPEERELTAEIIAFDNKADVAILRVKSNTPWPKPLSPYNAQTKIIEGTPIHFWGFPLGDILASGKKNPEITLGTGTVSSLRRTVGGKLDRVQISGTMNPGNSGGPLVDVDGRLVGIAVSIINPRIGTGIGFAVPVDDLIGLLEGKLLKTLFIPAGLDKNQANFVTILPIMDPLDKIETVFVRRWAGSGTPPEAVKDLNTGYKPFAMRKDGKANLPGVEEFPLKKHQTDSEMASSLGLALGEISVPLDAQQVMIQVASQTVANPLTGARNTAASQPIAYSLTISDLPVATDARPFTELTANPDSLNGQVVVVKGRIAAPPPALASGPIQDLIIVGLEGKRPEKMKFLVDSDMAIQFDEVLREHQPLPVRLVCLVGKRGDDGIVPVRVGRIDFIGRGNRIVHTMPAPIGATSELAALNRSPSNFAGRTLQLKVSAVPITPRVRDSNDFSVIFDNHRSPRNLRFVISDSMKLRMIEQFGKELRMNMVVPVRLTALVPDKPAAAGKTTITVTKIEFLDEDGKPVKSIE